MEDERCAVTRIEKNPILNSQKGKKIKNDDEKVTKEGNHGKEARVRDPEGVPFGEIDPGGNDSGENKTDETEIKHEENDPGKNETEIKHEENVPGMNETKIETKENELGKYTKENDPGGKMKVGYE